MKSIAVFAILFVGAALADWTAIGPPAGPVYSTAAGVSSPEVIYAAPQSEPCRVLRSTDGGSTWLFTAGMLGKYPFALACDPTDAGVVYAASGTMHKTTNGGTTWFQLPGPVNVYCLTIAILPRSPGTVYVGGYSFGTANRIVTARSADAGATWTTLVCDSTTMRMGYSVALDPADSSVIFAAGAAVGNTRTFLYKSTDYGVNWARTDMGTCGTPYDILVSSLDSRLVTLAASGGLYRSTDAGTSWSRIGTFSSVNQLAEVPADPKVMYAGTASTVYRSDDTGRTWVQAGNGLVGSGTFGLLAPAQSDSTVFRSTRAGVFCSTDRGGNWLPVMDGVVFNRAAAIAASDSADPALYVECRDNAVYRTRDNGTTWFRSPEFLSCGNICGVAVSPQDPDVVWALEGSG